MKDFFKKFLTELLVSICSLAICAYLGFEKANHDLSQKINSQYNSGKQMNLNWKGNNFNNSDVIFGDNK